MVNIFVKIYPCNLRLALEAISKKGLVFWILAINTYFHSSAFQCFAISLHSILVQLLLVHEKIPVWYAADKSNINIHVPGLSSIGLSYPIHKLFGYWRALVWLLQCLSSCHYVMKVVINFASFDYRNLQHSDWLNLEDSGFVNVSAKPLNNTDFF